MPVRNDGLTPYVIDLRRFQRGSLVRYAWGSVMYSWYIRALQRKSDDRDAGEEWEKCCDCALLFLSFSHKGDEPFHNEFTNAELTTLLKNFDVRTIKTTFVRAMFFFVAMKPQKRPSFA